MSDPDIIEQIGKELKVELRKVDGVEYVKGYTLNQNGQVAGLGLDNCEAKGS